MRKVGAILLAPLLVVGLVLTLAAGVFMYSWVGVAFNKKQRRDLAVSGAIRTFVKAGGEIKREEPVVSGEIEIEEKDSGQEEQGE